jgi:hydrogenase maturation protease
VSRGRRSVTVAGVEVGRGSRVVLRPREGADIMDRAMTGRVAVVHGIDEDMEGGVHLAVLLEDDPGADLGAKRKPGHRFFFSPEEVEPLVGSEQAGAPATRILVAGIGNIFFGDDGFGVEVAKRLGERKLPAGVEVADFGIRGLDLVYALGDGWDAAVFVDAVPRGEPPGTLFVIEPEIEAAQGGPVALDAHGMDPVKVLALAAELGSVPERMLVVGCQPSTVMTGEDEEIVGELSEPVRAALDEAVTLVESVVEELLTTREEGEEVRR